VNVFTGEQVPACLSNDRLTLMSEVTVVVALPGAVMSCGPMLEGYNWDGASIPRLMWPVMGHPLQADLRLASLAHDWLCEHSATMAERTMADAVLLYLLAQAGVAGWRRWCIWLAVRWYAFFVWSRR
jgi:hypothetical protein